MADKNKSKIKKINKRIEEYRENIPDKYNQIELLDYLTNPDYELFTSISNRADGKTYGYLGTLFRLALEFKEIRLLVITRHDELRGHMADVFVAFINDFGLDPDEFTLKPTSVGIRVYHKADMLAVITDLNDATDLKNASALLSEFKIMVYDEFLALESDYNPGEAYQLESIIGSVNRSPEKNPIIPRPKLFLLGNAVNFDSPILAYYNLINLFETQPLNTLETYGSKVVELRLNEQIQEENTTTLVAKDSPANTALFDINSVLVVPYAKRVEYENVLHVKVSPTEYLAVHYKDTKDFFVEFTSQPPKKYEFCLRTADYKKGVRQLLDDDMDRFYHYDHEEHRVKYGNTYTINYFENRYDLKAINLVDLVASMRGKTPKDNVEQNFKRNKLEEQKQRIFRRWNI